MDSCFSETEQSITDCMGMLLTERPIEQVLEKIETIVLSLQNDESNGQWKTVVIQLLQPALGLLNSDFNSIPCSPQKIVLPIENIELLLSLHFKLVDIALLYGVSRHTISRRQKECGLSARGSYTAISDEDLNEIIASILRELPNTGYKRMKGFLQSDGIKVPDQRVRSAMRATDPCGVYQRTLTNRAIVRRQYSVQFFNEVWHLDTNMKLIR